MGYGKITALYETMELRVSMSGKNASIYQHESGATNCRFRSM